MDDLFEYVGNLHIHSTYSDGARNIEDIVEIARQVNLDFLCFNDHNTLEGLHCGKEGWWGDVLVLIGTEINDRHHHYLAYNVHEPVSGNDATPQRVIDEVNRQGGFGFIAHPFEKGTPFSDSGHAFTWDDWSVKGYTGISIWNYSSDWKAKAQGIFTALYYYYNPKAAMKTPNPKTLSMWDRENQKRRVVAIGASDGHEFSFRKGPLSGVVFPYQFLFRAINTHILLRNPLKKSFKEDKAMLYSSLREGNCFVANDMLGDSRGFRFSSIWKQEHALMGEEMNFEKGLSLRVESPMKALIHLKKNGTTIHKTRDRKLEYEVQERGVYRVEVYRRGFFQKTAAWIFSNPIYVL